LTKLVEAARCQVLKTPVDLAEDECVVHESYTTNSYEWRFVTNKTTQMIHVPSRLAVNLGEAAVAAAVAGAGIARMLSYLVEDLLKSRSLVTLLEAYEPSPIPVSLVYPSQRRVPLKLRAFLDFAIPRLRKRLGYENT
jgi:DNA-binding transcriptional LysR family regulator